MTVLHLAPDTPALVQVAADAALVLHIGGGTLGILAGGAALLFRKGDRAHRLAGNVFFVSMLTMSGIGAIVAPMLPERLSAVAGAFTFYLVATAWATVKRAEGTIGLFEKGALFFVIACSAIAIVFGLIATESPGTKLDGYPAQGYFVLAGITGLTALADWTVIARGGVSGAQRIARHLWRMCVALFIAAGSLFLGQAQLFPKFIRASNILLVPELAILGLMIFWLLVTAFSRRFKSGATTLSLALGTRDHADHRSNI